MIEVTDEMIRAGIAAHFESLALGKARSDITRDVYRVMRALEPKEIKPKGAEILENPGQKTREEINQRNLESHGQATQRPLQGANGRMWNDPNMAEMDRRIAALERAARGKG